MSQVTVEFIFEDKKAIIPCSTTEKMIIICQRFCSLIKENISKIICKYNGKIINYDLTFEEIVNEKDKLSFSMNIIVEEKNLEKENNDAEKIINIENTNNKNKNSKNYIIGEIFIKDNDINKDIRIINSFEQYKKENKYNKGNDIEYENEKEIKGNCIIAINDKIIPFTYFHKFKLPGKYEIKYIFKENISKANHIFFGCKNLITIDLSNFNTKNINNISGMFWQCLSLTKINLINFNTQNVKNMSNVFWGCCSLTKIDLSSFNTENATNMNSMFSVCKVLTNLDLSNFNTQNVVDMGYMFCGCNSLQNIDLSNFNTQNVINMSYMFMGCCSLTNIDLSNFNTQNVIYMSLMLNGCESLSNIDLSNFNTQNVNDMYGMFYRCKNLKKENLITQDIKILNQYDEYCIIF